jgi:HK97 family phage portal protein
MAKVLDRVKAWLQKQSRAARAIVSLTLGQPVWTPRDYAGFARQGYQRNVYVYACVKQIAMACAGIPWVVYRKGRRGMVEELEDHPLARLLRRPNPWQGGSRFIENTVAFLMVAGNSYIEAVGPERGAPRELYVLRPDRVRVLPGNAQQVIAGYKYVVGGEEVRFAPEEILHLKLFNPLDDWYGMSPLEAAACSVDQNNESRAWNVALLQNSARPPGALVTEQALTDEQYSRLQREIQEKYAGSKNAGRPLLLEGGLDWKEMGLSPADMHWLEGMKLSAREIAIAFGVPPELIGDTANKTYSNYREAREAFYTETVLPLMDWLRDELNNWLVPKFGDDRVYLDYDKDEIEALQEDRDAVWDRALRAVERGVLTPNEARLLLGYEEVPGASVLLVSGNMMPLTVVSGGDVSEE